MSQRNILIVGGGPAGARAAYLLARSGARVTIFDPSHPREKPCGGGLTARAISLVAGMLQQHPPRGVQVTGLRFESGSLAAEFALSTRAETPLLVVDRRSFDLALLERAMEEGASHVAERVRDVAVDDTGVSVNTTTRLWRGDFLIGADGANSLTRRRLCAPFSRRQLSIATGWFAHGISMPAVIVRSLSQPPGYIWSFPRPDHLAIGICSQADLSTTAQLRRVTREWLEQTHLVSDARLEPYSWPIPSLSSLDFARERPAGDRWALVGDAAGLVDPLTREGIYYALRSAGLLADALGQAQPHSAYLGRLRTEVLPELVRAADLKARFFTSGFSDLMVLGLARSERVRRVMIDLVAGRQPYATLERRLVRTFELRLALRLLLLRISGRRAAR
jgi:geranylgeranyl reductase family protein